MTDEPGGWELKRALSEHRNDMREGFRTVNERLDKLVSADAYRSDQRRIDEQLKALAEDIAAERTARVEQIAHERETRTIEQNHEVTARREAVAAIESQMTKTAIWVRWLAASLILPIVLFIATLIAQRG